MPPKQALKQMTLHYTVHATELLDNVDAVLAALSCARAEVLWWFQHLEEASCPMSLHCL